MITGKIKLYGIGIIISLLSFILGFKITGEGLFYLQERGIGKGSDIEVVIIPSTIKARSFATFKVNFIIKAPSMTSEGKIKFRFPKGFYYLQDTNSNVMAFVTAKTTRPGVNAEIVNIGTKEYSLPWDWDSNSWIVTVKTLGKLFSGDTLIVTVGDNPPAGGVYALHSSYIDTLESAYSLNSSSNYLEMESRPVIDVQELAFSQCKAYLPSNAQTVDTAWLKIVTGDAYKNLIRDFEGIATINCTDPLAYYPKSIQFSQSDSGRKEIPVVFKSEGIHYIDFEIKQNSTNYLITGNSNPIEVTSKPQKRLYWGDLHSHSKVSHDGFGTQNFKYAEKISCLDFYAITDHTSGPGGPEHGGINPQEWKETKRKIKSNNKPGKFVTIPGYEYSQILPSGHHNIYFNVPDDSLDKIPLFRDDIFTQIFEVWRIMKEDYFADLDYLTIPHHSGLIFNKENKYPPLVSFGGEFANKQRRPAIEIYSEHGLSESYAPKHPLSYTNMKPTKILSEGPHYAQDAWALKEPLGVIASSDDHSGRPGLDFKGIAAVYADSLTRKEIFKGIKERHSYGTTGERIIIKFNINGKPMGSELQLGLREKAIIDFEVYGTGNLDFVDILRYSGRSRNRHPDFTIYKRFYTNERVLKGSFMDSSCSGEFIYYLRVKQKAGIYDPWFNNTREVWGWTTPIWVNSNFLKDAIAEDVSVISVFPNPFSKCIAVNYFLPFSNQTTIELYNSEMQFISTLYNNWQMKGNHILDFDNTNPLKAGIYFVILRSSGKTVVRKIVKVGA